MPFTLPVDSNPDKKTGFTLPVAGSDAPPSFWSTLGRRASDAWAGRPDIPPAPKSNAEFLSHAKNAIPGAMQVMGAVGGVIGSPFGAGEETLTYKGAKAAVASDDRARESAKYAGDRVQEVIPSLLFPEAQKLKNAPAIASDITNKAI